MWKRVCEEYSAFGSLRTLPALSRLLRSLHITFRAHRRLTEVSGRLLGGSNYIIELPGERALEGVELGISKSLADTLRR